MNWLRFIKSGLLGVGVFLLADSLSFETWTGEWWEFILGIIIIVNIVRR